MSPRSMTQQEHEQGYVICDCGRYTHIWRANLLRRLPRDYHGELCAQCDAWMCDLQKLHQAESDGASR